MSVTHLLYTHKRVCVCTRICAWVCVYFPYKFWRYNITVANFSFCLPDSQEVACMKARRPLKRARNSGVKTKFRS